MYVVVKNETSVISHGINKYTWKYLDEAKDFAKKQVGSTEDTVEICELTPVVTYNLKLVQEPEETGEEDKCPICGEPTGEVGKDTGEEPEQGNGPSVPPPLEEVEEEE